MNIEDNVIFKKGYYSNVWKGEDKCKEMIFLEKSICAQEWVVTASALLLIDKSKRQTKKMRRDWIRFHKNNTCLECANKNKVWSWSIAYYMSATR